VARDIPSTGRSGRTARAGPDRQLSSEGASLRGGRTTKIHVLSDSFCRPLAFALTGGQVADCKGGQVLLDNLTATDILHADKGYDSYAIRCGVAEHGVMPNIAPKRNRRWRPSFSVHLYRNRNAIERMFGRLKDFRGIATRYDRLAINYLTAVCLSAAICYWL
jgi:transposase